MESQYNQSVSPEFSLGEKFCYNIIKAKTLKITNLYGDEYFFEDISKIKLTIIDFFVGKENEYKVKYNYNGKDVLTRWFFESELLNACLLEYIRSAN